MKQSWDTFLTDQDREVVAASGYTSPVGFGKRPALLIVDVSYAFTGDRPEPILDSIKRFRNACGPEAWKAVSVIKTVAERFRAKKLPVIYTKEYCRNDKWDLGGWAWKNRRALESAHPGLDPNEIVAELTPHAQDIVVPKQKPSAFFGTGLSGYLMLLGCDSIIVTGTATSGCVRATVCDAFSHNLRVAVVADGCFDRIQSSHTLNLFEMNAKYGDVVSSSAIIDHIGNLPDNLFDNLPSAQVR